MAALGPSHCSSSGADPTAVNSARGDVALARARDETLALHPYFERVRFAVEFLWDESDQVLHGVDDRFTPVALSLCSVLGSSAQSLRESFAQSLRGRGSQGRNIPDPAPELAGFQRVWCFFEVRDVRPAPVFC